MPRVRDDIYRRTDLDDEPDVGTEEIVDGGHEQPGVLGITRRVVARGVADTEATAEVVGGEPLVRRGRLDPADELRRVVTSGQRLAVLAATPGLTRTTDAGGNAFTAKHTSAAPPRAEYDLRWASARPRPRRALIGSASPS